MQYNKIPPLCRFFQSQFVHRQICRHGSRRCRTSQEALSPERPENKPNEELDLITIIFPAYPVRPHTSSCVAWGWKTLSSSKMRSFPLFSTLSEDSLLGSVVTTTDWPSSCWSSFSTGFTRHSTRMLPDKKKAQLMMYGSYSAVFFPSLLTFKLHQLLVVLPAQCNLLPVFLQEIFVGFRHLTNSCCNLTNRQICNKKK